MKKNVKSILAGVTIPLMLVPMLANAQCTTGDANFCSCFIESSIEVCKEKGKHHGIPPKQCKSKFISDNIKHSKKVSSYCKQYLDLMPEGIDQSKCNADLSYFKSHC